MDSSGSAYVTGQTTSTNFPTINPIRNAFGGGSPDGDAFVSKLREVVPPVANDDAYNTAEETVLTVAAPGVLGNDTDAASSPLTASIVSQPAHGSVTLNSNGSFTYTPASNYNGGHSFTYKANNGTTDSNTATVSITINGVNDAPVNTVPGAQTTNRNTALLFSAANSNLISISDIDAAASLVQVTLTATGGTLSLSGVSGLSFSAGDGTADATTTFTGTIVSINAALSGLSFTPATNFTRAAALQITTNDQGNTGAGGPLSDTDNITITVFDAHQLQLSSYTYTVGEAAGRATITITRTGDTSQPASVDIATSDLSGLNDCSAVTGNASQRCDYTAVVSTLNFHAGEATKTFTVPVIDDVYTEGSETLTVTLSNPAGGELGSTVSATVTITDNDASPGTVNPLNQRDFFIRQLYLDVLNREPEPAGLAAWLDRLNTCPRPGETLQNCDEIEVASAFFRSPEFFDRAYFIYKFYEAALSRQPQYDEYQRDLRRMTGFLTAEELEQRKREFAEEFVNRAEFRSLYDSFGSGQPFVDAVLTRAGSARPGVGAATVTTSNRVSVINRMAAGQITRAQGLRELMEAPEISQRFFNKAFVVVGYFAFLRKNPDAAYLHWIDVLNTTGDYRVMIRGLMQSSEYRLRFGPI